MMILFMQMPFGAQNSYRWNCEIANVLNGVNFPDCYTFSLVFLQKKKY